MLPKSMNEPYLKFYDAVSENTILGPKVTVMIKLAAAMSYGCAP